MSNRKGYRGYIGSRPYRGECTPQAVQNLVIRNYCHQNGFTYLLSATEYAMSGCYLMLNEVACEASTLDGIVLYSLFMLPGSAGRRRDLCRRMLAAGASIHGALENIAIHTDAELEKVEEMLLIQQCLRQDVGVAPRGPVHSIDSVADRPGHSKEVDFLSCYQKATRRDYRQRVLDHDKAEVAAVAKQWGFDYWDGDRRFGYGGYKYDGRWLPIARDIARYYGLKPGDRILDIGCGKGFLLYEFTQAVPGVEVTGIDISDYALAHAKEEVKGGLHLGNAADLPWPDHSFDLVISLNTFHNLRAFELKRAVQEMERVGRRRKWLCVESYRNDGEKVNLLYWQLTCASFYDTEEWAWLLAEWGYKGDYGFIFFE